MAQNNRPPNPHAAKQDGLTYYYTSYDALEAGRAWAEETHVKGMRRTWHGYTDEVREIYCRARSTAQAELMDVINKRAAELMREWGH